MPGTPTHVLFESAVGLALFKVEQVESIGSQTKQVQEAMLKIKKRFGKNAILKGTNLQEGATAKERNAQIGGHKA